MRKLIMIIAVLFATLSCSDNMDIPDEKKPCEIEIEILQGKLENITKGIESGQINGEAAAPILMELYQEIGALQGTCLVR